MPGPLTIVTIFLLDGDPLTPYGCYETAQGARQPWFERYGAECSRVHHQRDRLVSYKH